MEQFAGRVMQGENVVARVDGWVQPAPGNITSGLIGGLTTAPDKARRLVQCAQLLRLVLEDGRQGDIVVSELDPLSREVKFQAPSGLT